MGPSRAVQRLPSRRAGLRTAALVAVAAMAVSGWMWNREGVAGNRNSICLEVVDATGLYPDAPVAIRGISIGRVTAIGKGRSSGMVRVDAVIDRERIARSTRAAIVNTGIITDRRVELIDAVQPGAPALPADTCVTDTAVPVSVNNALTSMRRLVSSLTAPDADGRSPMTHLLDALGDRVDANSGERINATLQSLGNGLTSPDEFINQSRTLLGQILPLLKMVVDIREVIVPIAARLSAVFDVVGGIFGVGTQIITALGDILVPVYTEVLTKWYPRWIRGLLDGIEPVMSQQVALLNANAPTIAKALAPLPGVVRTLRDMVTPRGALDVTIAPPKVKGNVSALCAAARQPKPCASRGPMTGAQLTSLLFSALGGPR